MCAVMSGPTAEHGKLGTGMSEVESLQHHYDRKYAGAQTETVRRVEIRRHPRNRYEAMASLAGGGDSLLEVGPGSGVVMLTLADSFAHMVGMELSGVRADALSALFDGNPSVSILCEDIERAGSLRDDDMFDVVVMSAVLEHLVDPIEALKVILAHIKPGGRLVLDTPNIAKWTRRIKLLCGRFPGTASLDEGLLMYDRMTPTDLYDEGHFHYFTYRSLRRVLVERVGFSDVRAAPYGGPLCRAYPRLFAECCVVARKSSRP